MNSQVKRMAGVDGIGPPLGLSESLVLPLYDTPITENTGKAFSNAHFHTWWMSEINLVPVVE